MAITSTLPPFPFTGGFRADWQVAPMEQFVFSLRLSPGTYELSVLPDLVVMTSAIGAVTPDDINAFAEEVLISSAYVTRRVGYYDGNGLYHLSESLVAHLQAKTDTLAEQAMAGAGFTANYGSFDYYSNNISIEAAKTIGSNVYTGDYFLHVDGWNTSYTHQPDGISVPMSGRFMVTLGNPTGQRSDVWGGEWLNVLSFFDSYQPPVVPPPAAPTELDPLALPPSISFSNTASQTGIETLPILTTVDAAWWKNTGITVLQGYASMALDAFRQLADASGLPRIGAMLDVVNAGTTAVSVRDFLHGVVAQKWAQLAEGMSLAALAGANPNPHAYSQQISDLMSRSAQTDQAAIQQKARDTALSIVLDKIVSGAGTVWSVFRDTPYAATEKNSFSLGLQLPGMTIQGSERSDAVAGGDGNDTISLGAGVDLVQGFAGDDVLNTGAGNDWLAGGAGNDWLNGDTGLDTAVFSGSRQNYTVAASGSGFAVTDTTGSQGSDTLQGIERLHFDDKKLALDLRADQAGAQALELIGILAPARINEPAIVGWVLSLFDQGISMHAMCQIMIDIGVVSQLAGSGSHADLVRLLHRNVVGTEADAATVDYWSSLLDGRQGHLSHADLMNIIAPLEINQTHIGLMGYQLTGVEIS